MSRRESRTLGREFKLEAAPWRFRPASQVTPTGARHNRLRWQRLYVPYLFLT